jgi:hypothetical protein
METTAIIAVIVNLIISIICTIDSAREIKKNPVLQAYYKAQSKAVTIMSWVFAIITNLAIYGLVLYGSGLWGTLGWILIVLDMVSMIIFCVVLRVLTWKLG